MRRLSDRELLNLVLRGWDDVAPLAQPLQRTGVFLWLLTFLLLAALILDMCLAGGRLKKHCDDLARPGLHIECAQSGERKAGREGQDVRHAADADLVNRSRP